MMPTTLTTSGLRKLLSSVVVFGLSASPACATEAPSSFTGLVGVETASPADIANKNLLQLNTTMFQLYGDAAQIFKKNILAKHPIILGLFSGAGGRFILYRPGMAPIEAPQAPIVYQLLKSVGHSTMALAEVVVPYLNSPKDTTWRAALAAYRSRMQSALDTLDASGMQKDWRTNNRSILQNNIAFMDECLKSNAISTEGLQKFAKKQSPLLKKNIAWAAQTQVAHWMDVIAGWKEMLGADWDKTYAASNTIYVARQNNVLFSVLAQFFGPDAINDRLMLIETISFTTTPDDMLESLTRIIADRSVGAAFFGDYHLMDFELMGGDARQAIIDEDAKRKMNVVLPPQVPFGSRQWPTLITPGPGAKSLSDLP
ncbi:hypothetical protein IYX23_14220 [Methylocystis sp. L43]|uniref:hypothetical protein n=1 Tax=unclassified Methylocystis TaxID=2625913 RepID=UPI0018C2891E|nr:MULTISPECIES: hypothetical protein [unclassified Methylocystis]MBG0798826.1 hypothetical protein [Methylocystis sp. L43]MBG0806333.1 hypothetical protein [Methylocystis sp. H15]